MGDNELRRKTMKTTAILAALFAGCTGMTAQQHSNPIAVSGPNGQTAQEKTTTPDAPANLRWTVSDPYLFAQARQVWPPDNRTFLLSPLERRQLAQMERQVQRLELLVIREGTCDICFDKSLDAARERKKQMIERFANRHGRVPFKYCAPYEHVVDYDEKEGKLHMSWQMFGVVTDKGGCLTWYGD
jgi:hypothetical protein